MWVIRSATNTNDFPLLIWMLHSQLQISVPIKQIFFSILRLALLDLQNKQKGSNCWVISCTLSWWLMIIPMRGATGIQMCIILLRGMLLLLNGEHNVRLIQLWVIISTQSTGIIWIGSVQSACLLLQIRVPNVSVRDSSDCCRHLPHPLKLFCWGGGRDLVLKMKWWIWMDNGNGVFSVEQLKILHCQPQGREASCQLQEQQEQLYIYIYICKENQMNLSQQSNTHFSHMNIEGKVSVFFSTHSALLLLFLVVRVGQQETGLMLLFL